MYSKGRTIALKAAGIARMIVYGLCGIFGSLYLFFLFGGGPVRSESFCSGPPMYALSTVQGVFDVSLEGLWIWLFGLAFLGVGCGFIERRIATGNWVVADSRRLSFILLWSLVYPITCAAACILLGRVIGD